MENIVKGICYFFRKIYLRYSKHCIFRHSSILDWPTKFEGSNLLDKRAELRESYIGYASYLGEGTKLAQCYIGRYSCIGPYVSMVIGKHPTNFASIHPAFFSMRKQSGFTYVGKQKYEEFSAKTYMGKYSTWIGNDVWIGARAVLMDGVKIGDGAVIGAGALITKDVEPYSIVTGIPGRVYKYRFDDNEKEFLLKLKWWDKSRKWIQEHAEYFENIDELKRHIEEEIE